LYAITQKRRNLDLVTSNLKAKRPSYSLPPASKIVSSSLQVRDANILIARRRSTLTIPKTQTGASVPVRKTEGLTGKVSAKEVLREVLRGSSVASRVTYETFKEIMSSMVTPQNLARSALIVGASVPLMFVASGGTIIGLLSFASSLGISAVPTFVWSFASSLGVSLAGQAGIKGVINALKSTSRGKKILDAKIPKVMMNRWTRILGIPLDNNTTFGDVLSSTVTASASIFTGGMTSFVFSRGIGATIEGVSNIPSLVRRGGAAVANAYSERAKTKLRNLPVKIMDKVDALKDEEVDSFNIMDEVLKEVEVINKELKEEVGSVPEIPARRQVRKEKKSIDEPVASLIQKGRIAMLSTAAVSAAVALATGTADLSLIGGAISSGSQSVVDLALESEMATKTIISIVTSTGASKLVNPIIKKVVGDKFKKALSGGSNSKALNILTGGKVYGANALKKLSKQELLKIAKNRGLNLVVGSSIEEIRKKVYEAESKAVADLQGVLQTIVSSALVAGVGGVVSAGMSDVMEKLKVEPLPGSAAIVEPPPVEIPLDELKIPLERVDEVVRDQEVFSILESTPEQEFDLALESARADAFAKGELERATEAQAKLEVEKAVKEAQESARLAREEHLLEKRRIFDEIRDKRPLYSKPAGPELPKTAGPSDAAIRAAQKIATRRLREAALLEQTSLNADVVIMKPAVFDPVTGQQISGPEAAVGTAVPVMEMDPRIEEALSAFEFTPLMMKVAKMGVESATGFIPGVGSLNSMISNINTGLDVATFMKRVSTINTVVTNINAGEAVDMEAVRQGMAAGIRIPTLGDAINSAWKVDSVNLGSVVKDAIAKELASTGVEALKGGINVERLYLSIGRQVLWGQGAGEGLGLTDWMLSSIGKQIYDLASTGGSSQTRYL
jgi:hypothetical protein